MQIGGADTSNQTLREPIGGADAPTETHGVLDKERGHTYVSGTPGVFNQSARAPSSTEQVPTSNDKTDASLDMRVVGLKHGIDANFEDADACKASNIRQRGQPKRSYAKQRGVKQSNRAMRSASNATRRNNRGAQSEAKPSNVTRKHHSS